MSVFSRRPAASPSTSPSTSRPTSPLTRTRLLTIATAGVLVAGLGVGPSVADENGGTSDTASARGSLSGAQGGYRGRNQTSDGKPGTVVGPPPSLRGRSVQVKNDVSYQIAPGVVLREWDQVDGRQPIGQVRMNLVTVDLDAPNISFEELSPKYVTKRNTVSQLGRWNGVLGAVNGDFFDISETGAPLGVAIHHERGILNAAREGWIPGVNSSLWFDTTGPHVSPLTVQYTIRQRRAWTVSGLNHPEVPSGQIGVFTHDWNRTSGNDVLPADKKRAREVVLWKNRVVSNRPKLSDGRKIRKNNRVLVGVGPAAAKLAQLKPGKKITLSKRIEGGRPTVAISGDRPLLVNGLRSVINNTIAHPRTAVGIDADGRRLLILVVDGRSASSRGYTMVELADLMTALGAENALNLDGGGSSAMYTRTGTGAMGIVNEPSDGGERLVPNAFGVVYHAPLPPVVPILPPTVPPTPTPTPTVTPTPTPTP
ncbi:hypothetical protein CFI00_19440 [Nocardioides sp. S5]|uniref:phosphodiester glycosidase family protein n=1 Tax=Nocardioides sp. S5 TaxID=2017486 RepID=UPI001A8F3AF9|nr:phosphodiester glycosidase family protein [Nocardioides sp. S5]QSR32627.1 hypothetical protein CFI00_19440 [Nocardioides sp. S5]